jgi:hypothetical protein
MTKKSRHFNATCILYKSFIEERAARKTVITGLKAGTMEIGKNNCGQCISNDLKPILLVEGN